MSLTVSDCSNAQGTNCASRSPNCVRGGNGWIELGSWRFGAKDKNHFVISHSSDLTRPVRVFRADGAIIGSQAQGYSLHSLKRGPLVRTDQSPTASVPSLSAPVMSFIAPNEFSCINNYETSQQDGNAYNISFGDGFMEMFGTMRWGQTEVGKGVGFRGSTASHFTISTRVKNIYIYRGDGYRVAQNSHGTWKKSKIVRLRPCVPLFELCFCNTPHPTESKQRLQQRQIHRTWRLAFRSG